MSVPKGLRKPRRVAFLIPILLALAVVGAGAIYGLYQVAWQAAHPSVQIGDRLGAVARGPGAFHWEILFGLGTLVLLAAMAYGAWSYHDRDRSKDKLTEKATRELYGESPTSADGRDGRRTLGPS